MFRSLFVGSALVVCLAASVHVVQAQVDIDRHKAEVGGLYTIMSLKDFDERFGLIPGSGGDHEISGVAPGCPWSGISPASPAPMPTSPRRANSAEPAPSSA